MAEKVKNEHYVPQRYLKHFANGENFFVFDKEENIYEELPCGCEYLRGRTGGRKNLS